MNYQMPYPVVSCWNCHTIVGAGYPTFITPLHTPQNSPPTSTKTTPEAKNEANKANQENTNTVICTLWLQNQCTRENCNFAHSYNIQPRQVNRNFKKEACDKQNRKGGCPYKLNCNYKHQNEACEFTDKGVIVRIQHPLTGHLIICRIGHY